MERTANTCTIALPVHMKPLHVVHSLFSVYLITKVDMVACESRFAPPTTPVSVTVKVSFSSGSESARICSSKEAWAWPETNLTDPLVGVTSSPGLAPPPTRVTVNSTDAVPTVLPVLASGREKVRVVCSSSTTWVRRASPKNPIVPNGIPLCVTMMVALARLGLMNTLFEAEVRETVNLSSGSGPELGSTVIRITPDLWGGGRRKEEGGGRREEGGGRREEGGGRREEGGGRREEGGGRREEGGGRREEGGGRREEGRGRREEGGGRREEGGGKRKEGGRKKERG